MSSTARMFTLAIHHDKEGNEITADKVTEILKDYQYIHDIFAIYHDRDDTKQPHWHFVILCKNPRNFSTIANIFNVEPNFVEKVINKRKMLRYLIHLDNPEKEQYEPEEVLTNLNPNEANYKDIITSLDITNKQLFEDIATNGASAIYNYIDTIEPNRLATIQRLVGTEYQKRLEAKVYRMSEDIQRLNHSIDILSNIQGQLLQNVIDTKIFLEDTRNEFIESGNYLVKQGIPQIVTAFDTAIKSLTNAIVNTRLPNKKY